MKAQWLNTEWVSCFQTSHFMSGSRARYYNYWTVLIWRFCDVIKIQLHSFVILHFYCRHECALHWNTFFKSKYNSRLLKGKNDPFSMSYITLVRSIMMDLKKESVQLTQWYIRIICSIWRFYFNYFTNIILNPRGVWLASFWSTSLRTGHTATTRGCPPVVKEDFTVKIN